MYPRNSLACRAADSDVHEVGEQEDGYLSGGYCYLRVPKLRHSLESGVATVTNCPRGVIGCDCGADYCRKRQRQSQRSSCDVCGVTDRPTATVIAYGIETNACNRCRGAEEEE